MTISNQRFAFGHKAKAQCPLCGDVVKYIILRQDWRGQYVCPDCWDPKHPQERQVNVLDTEALHHARVLQDQPKTLVPRRVVQQNMKLWLGSFTVTVT